MAVMAYSVPRRPSVLMLAATLIWLVASACGTEDSSTTPATADTTGGGGTGTTGGGGTGGTTGGTGTFTLTVIVQGSQGSGAGAVIGTGINCPGDCQQMFTDGTSVISLTATPEAGSLFDGWSGGCQGLGQCNVTMNADRSVTATFRLAG